MADLDVLCFGEALVDFFPDRLGVPLAEVDVFHRHLGGAPANVAVGLARLGVRTGLMTLVGQDAFGRFVRAQLEHEGIDVSTVGVHPSARTGIAFVALGPAGERSFLFYRHPSADQQITAAHVDDRAFGRARVAHFGSSTLSSEPARSATWKALEAARAQGLTISADPNLRFHLWPIKSDAVALTRQLIAASNVVKLSEDELEPLVDTADPVRGAQAVRALGPTLVVVTLGERGAYFNAPCGTGHVPGLKVAVADTTGAGDAFVAGLWAALLARLAPAAPTAAALAALSCADLEVVCTQGNHMGAAAVTALGATTALPRRPPGSGPAVETAPRP